MENKGLNKVDLIFEKVDAKEVLTSAYKMKNNEIIQQVLESGLKGRNPKSILYVMLMKASPEHSKTGKYSTRWHTRYTAEWL